MLEAPSAPMAFHFHSEENLNLSPSRLQDLASSLCDPATDPLPSPPFTASTLTLFLANLVLSPRAFASAVLLSESLFLRP